MWKGLRLVLAWALLGLSACSVDAEVQEYCRLRTACECDDAGTCCITQGEACFEGQCCDGLVCSASGVCVAG
jgi:hypothetical protein